MKWPWRFHDPTGGAEAKQRAVAYGNEIERKQREVNRLSKSLANLRQDNNFAVRFEEAMRLRRKH